MYTRLSVHDENYPFLLIVEDDPIQAKVVEKQLQSAYPKVISVHNTEDALKIMSEKEIAVIVLDWDLGEQSGSDFLVQNCQPDSNFNTIVIMLTAHRDPEKLKFALECGATDFISKPASSIELRARVAVAMRLYLLQKNLRDMALRDALTGLYNRRYFQESIEREVIAFGRYHHQFSLAIIDIDFFKKINDSYGHDVGDYAIKEMAQLIASMLRKTDYLCRIGGEEYAIILRDTSAKNASIVINRILEIAKSRIFIFNNNKFTLTFSCGIAEISKEINEGDLLYRLADKALYKSKMNGRAQVTI